MHIESCELAHHAFQTSIEPVFTQSTVLDDVLQNELDLVSTFEARRGEDSLTFQNAGYSRALCALLAFSHKSLKQLCEGRDIPFTEEEKTKKKIEDNSIFKRAMDLNNISAKKVYKWPIST